MVTPDGLTVYDLVSTPASTSVALTLTFLPKLAVAQSTMPFNDPVHVFPASPLVAGLSQVRRVSFMVVAARESGVMEKCERMAGKRIVEKGRESDIWEGWKTHSGLGL